MLTYYRIHCGGMYGAVTYWTEAEAVEAARVRTALSGHQWEVQTFLCNTAVVWRR